MQSIKSASLKNYTTLHLNVQTNRLFEIQFQDELVRYFSYINPTKENWLILGGGSNVLFTKDYEGDILVIRIKGRQIIKEDSESITLKIGAGETWHDLVEWAVNKNYGGIENLALIPGTCGAAPIQNIGAYGVELKDVLESVEFFNVETLNFESLTADLCQFGYRDSVFKGDLKTKTIITSITIKLHKSNYAPNTGYAAVNQWMIEHNIGNPALKDVFDAVVSIRRSKLPDPKEIGNAGSFFKNPIISTEQFLILKNDFDSMPFYQINETQVKIPAGWLIEKAGWKGFRNGDVGVFPKQALVLVNYGNASANDILKLSQNIIHSVYDKFTIKLEPEVNII